MTEESLASRAINATMQFKDAYCKFLSANDSGETGAHQVGILISKSAGYMMFEPEILRDTNHHTRSVDIFWQEELHTISNFKWYPSKNELRITTFGRNFPYLVPSNTGALFILIQVDNENYLGYFLTTEEEIQKYLDAFGMSPVDTNRPVEISNNEENRNEKAAIEKCIENFDETFPVSEKMSGVARVIYNKINPKQNWVCSDPDRILIEWTKEEYKLFQALELVRYGEKLKNGFNSVDEFVTLANTVLNRRKSRAGKSLEHHLAYIFDKNSLKYTAQGITEGRKKPDFIFPSVEDYHNPYFSVSNLCTLAAKTTCKDRWRQVLNEADRLRDDYKYLCTLQQGISSAQMEEMQQEKVRLVVPKQYFSSYPKEQRKNIWTLKEFIRYVKELEAI